MMTNIMITFGFVSILLNSSDQAIYSNEFYQGNDTAVLVWPTCANSPSQMGGLGLPALIRKPLPRFEKALGWNPDVERLNSWDDMHDSAYFVPVFIARKAWYPMETKAYPKFLSTSSARQSVVDDPLQLAASLLEVCKKIQDIALNPISERGPPADSTWGGDRSRR